jgi:hypothetical protein
MKNSTKEWFDSAESDLLLIKEICLNANLTHLSAFQAQQAIAVEDGITQPTSGKFIPNHNLTSASSVNTSLKALEDKEMIA